MQNRSTLPAKRKFDPVELPDEFPVRLAGPHSPSTGPVDSLHLHDCLELGYCLEGAGVFMVEDKLLPFAAGDATVINDRETHRARSAAGGGGAAGGVSSWNWVLLDPARLFSAALRERDALRTGDLCGPGFRNVFRPGAHPEVVTAIRRIVEELTEEKSGYRAVVKGLVLSLLGLLHRLAGEAESGPSQAARDATERIAPALDHLSLAYSEPVAVPKLAELCYMSASSFRRVFRQATGRSPQEYLTYLRVQMASALLESTGLTVLEISGRVGYPTLSSFNRHFRRIMRASPREWRKSAAK